MDHLVFEKVTFFHLFRHSGAKHHHLLVMRSLNEDILNISPHLGVSQHFVTLVDNEKLALHRTNLTFSNWISLCLAKSYKRPGVEMMMWGVLVGSLSSV